MAPRKYPLITGEIYHVFNRGNNKQPTFTKKREYERALSTISYYKYQLPPVKLSRYLACLPQLRDAYDKRLQDCKKIVHIISFCLMPNHYHLILYQNIDNGISKFIANFQNSYTKYFNKRNKRDGGLFLDQFKAIRVENDEQLIHTNRYIHLNPYSSYIVTTLKDNESYPWSSLSHYLKRNSNIIDDHNLILGIFKKNKKSYRKFINDQADYQRSLNSIKHLVFE